jgi:hypothetical protein
LLALSLIPISLARHEQGAIFGLQTLDIIEAQGERLIEVPGIGQKRAGMIQRAWAAQKAIKEVMVFLQASCPTSCRDD